MKLTYEEMGERIDSTGRIIEILLECADMAPELLINKAQIDEEAEWESDADFYQRLLKAYMFSVKLNHACTVAVQSFAKDRPNLLK